LVDLLREFIVAGIGTKLHVAHLDFGVGERARLRAARRSRLPICQRLHVETRLQPRREILVAFDHCLRIVTIEIVALFRRELSGQVSVLVVELRRPIF